MIKKLRNQSYAPKWEQKRKKKKKNMKTYRGVEEKLKHY
jgi:hypothetical protein